MMKAGRELDRLIAETVMGWRLKHWRDETDGGTYWVSADGEFAGKYSVGSDPKWRWSPSTDIAAAWQVVDKMNLLHDASCLGYDESNSEWIIFEVCCPYDGEVIAVGETPELAICRAALEARERWGE